MKATHTATFVVRFIIGNRPNVLEPVEVRLTPTLIRVLSPRKYAGYTFNRKNGYAHPYEYGATIQYSIDLASLKELEKEIK